MLVLPSLLSNVFSCRIILIFGKERKKVFKRKSEYMANSSPFQINYFKTIIFFFRNSCQ